jgi:hypothetical protein
MQIWLTDKTGKIIGKVVNVKIPDNVSVKPGESFDFGFYIDMPTEPGTYYLNMQLWKFANGEWTKVGDRITKKIIVAANSSKGNNQSLLKNVLKLPMENEKITIVQPVPTRVPLDYSNYRFANRNLQDRAKQDGRVTANTLNTTRVGSSLYLKGYLWLPLEFIMGR